MDLSARLHPRRVVESLGGSMDRPLLWVVLMLIAAGLVTLYSASYDSPARMQAQLVNLAVAALGMWIAARIPPQTLMRLAVPAYILGILFLVAVALFGDVANGARRWLHVGVPLPFISYGGTSLATLFVGIGILMSVQRHRKLVQT